MLLEYRYIGGRSKLTTTQEQELKAFLKINIQRTARERLNLNGALNLGDKTAVVAVRTWLKKHRRFKLHFLPPYSPNLNLIERLWRFFHLKVTWNRYFATFDEFRKETLKFFKRLSRYGPEPDTLLTDNFQVIPVLNLQT